MCFTLGLGYLFSSCQTSITVKEKLNEMSSSMTSIVKTTKLIDITSGNSQVDFYFYNISPGVMKCGGGFSVNITISATVKTNLSYVHESTTKLKSYLKNNLNSAIQENVKAISHFLGSIPNIKTTTDLSDTINHITDTYMTSTNITDIVTTNITTDKITFINTGIIEAEQCNVTLKLAQTTFAHDLITNLTKVYDTNKTLSDFRNKYTQKVSLKGKGIGGIIGRIVGGIESVVHSVTATYIILGIIVILIFSLIIVLPIVLIIMYLHKKHKKYIQSQGTSPKIEEITVPAIKSNTMKSSKSTSKISSFLKHSPSKKI